MIRNGETNDAKKIAKIKIDNWRKTYLNIFPDELLKNLEIDIETKKCINNLNNKNVIVYEKDGEVIAYCYYGKRNNLSYKEYEGEVFALYVKNECQEHGVGTKLLNYAIKDLFKKYKKVLLWCAKENTRAISFYEKNGLVKLGEEIENIGGKNVEKVALGISLEEEHLYKIKKSANYIENDENVAIYTNPNLIFLKDKTKKWFKEIVNGQKDSSIPQKFIDYLLAKEVIEIC